jgi:exodeoxyribonuclease VII large subunit
LAIGDALLSRFAITSVRGEISGFSRASSGHCYFTLKDDQGADATIRCAMFRRSASSLSFAPADGQQVELRGRLAVYESRGELQLVVEAMQLCGQGALMERFQRLKAQLTQEGLFDVARKRPLPGFVRRIGIVTSLEAAALHDVVASLSRRAPHVELVIYPASVQGPQASATLSAALRMAESRREVEVLLLCRGGGSLEDLWAFNEPELVRAVAACSIPVVTGIGHDTDVSLCDFAADVHAPTPTAAAELATPATEAIFQLLHERGDRLSRRVHATLDAHGQRLDRHALRLLKPAHLLQKEAQALSWRAQRLAAALGRQVPQQRVVLERAAHRLQGTLHRALQQHEHRHQGLAQGLAAVDPHRVLSRGYAWLSDERGQPLTSTQALSPGQSVQARMSDGVVDLTVQAVRSDKPRAPDN